MNKTARDIVPSFQLYGEAEQHGLPDLIHVETLKDRSQHHDWRIWPHRHLDLFQIMRFHTIDIDIDLDGDVTTTTEPAILFVPPRVVHGFHFSPRVVGTVTTVPLEALRGGRGVASIDAFPFMVLSSAQAFERLSKSLDELEEEYRHQRRDRQLALQALLELVMTWAIRARDESHESIARLGSRGNSELRVHGFLALVEQHFTKGWSAVDYAREVGTSKSQLTRDCRAVAGCSPMQIVHDRLIREANRKLAYTPWPIAQISETLGFTDLGYFSRFYRERTGEAPSRYRARFRSRTVE